MLLSPETSSDAGFASAFWLHTLWGPTQLDHHPDAQIAPPWPLSLSHPSHSHSKAPALPATASAVGEHSPSILWSSLISLGIPQQHLTGRAWWDITQTLSSSCSRMRCRTCWVLGSHPRGNKVCVGCIVVERDWRETMPLAPWVLPPQDLWPKPSPPQGSLSLGPFQAPFPALPTH